LFRFWVKKKAYESYILKALLLRPIFIINRKFQFLFWEYFLKPSFILLIISDWLQTKQTISKDSFSNLNANLRILKSPFCFFIINQVFENLIDFERWSECDLKSKQKQKKLTWLHSNVLFYHFKMIFFYLNVHLVKIQN
jgi:hypothetical protein